MKIGFQIAVDSLFRVVLGHVGLQIGRDPAVAHRLHMMHAQIVDDQDDLARSGVLDQRLQERSEPPGFNRALYRANPTIPWSYAKFKEILVINHLLFIHLK